MSEDSFSADDGSTLKRKREEIASSTEDDDARIPKPLYHFPGEVRAVMREKCTEIRALSTVCQLFTSEEQHHRFSEMMADTVRRAIEECPDIVRVGQCPPNKLSLLQLLINLPREGSHPRQFRHLFTDAIKDVIEKNPLALTWPGIVVEEEGFLPISLFGQIARSDNHPGLLPWVVEEYGHMLCSGVPGDDDPMHFDLVCGYARGFCDATTVRMFYEAHPIALMHQAKGDMNDRLEDGMDEYMGKGYPLHYAMREDEPDDEDYDLFEWIVEQNTEALQHKDPLGRTILHQIFMTYQDFPRVFSGYGHLVINASPAIVFVKDKKGKCAAHYLSNRAVRGIGGYPWLDGMLLVRLLRGMFSTNLIDDELRTDPFVVGIEKVLEKEHRLSMNLVQIRRVEMMIDKAIAVKSGDTSVLSEVKEVYGDWSQKHLPAIKAAIKTLTDEDIPRVYSETRGVQNESSEEDEDSSEESSDEGEN